MRRPAPLPASADEPEDIEPGSAETEAPAVSAGSIGRFGAGRRGGQEPENPPVPADDGETQPLDEVLSAPPAGTEKDQDAAAEGLRSADVWRAARARRRALRAEIRRFTQRSRRRRMILWGSVGAVLALVLGSVIAAYSPLFAVEKIVVAGTKTLDAASVEQALAGQIGAPLALVDASAVKSALTEFPMIETYALEARPPHELLVRIVERTPIGVLDSDAGFTLVDAAGVALSTTQERPEGQPLLDVSGGRDSAAFRSAGLVVRSLPADLRATITGVRATSGDDVTLTTSDGKTIVWGSEENSVTKARVLVDLIKAAPKARTFDISSPNAAVVR